MIAISSAAGAVIADIAWFRPEILISLHEGPLVSSSTAVALLAFGLMVYTCLAIILVSAIVAFDLHRAQTRLSKAQTPTRRTWFDAFKGTGLMPIAGRLLDLADYGDDLILQSRFDARAIRREFSNHYRDWLTRAHTFTAFTLLLLLSILELAQRYDAIAIPRGIIPIVEILAAIATIIILCGISRLAVAVIEGSLVNSISRLSLKRLDILLLQQAFSPGTVRIDWEEKLQYLGLTLEQASQLFRETIDRFSTTTKTLTETASNRAMNDRMLGELSSAIKQLSATVGRGTAASAPAPGATGQPSSQMGKKVRELLADFR